MKQAFTKQITGNVNRIVKLHEVCVDKIVDYTEQPLKANTVNANRAVLIQAFSKQITGNVAWIVRVTRSQCRHYSGLTEQPIKTRQSMQTRQFFETSI